MLRKQQNQRGCSYGLWVDWIRDGVCKGLELQSGTCSTGQLGWDTIGPVVHGVCGGENGIWHV